MVGGVSREGDSQAEPCTDWPKSSFGFFCMMFGKNPNELLGQPDRIGRGEGGGAWERGDNAVPGQANSVRKGLAHLSPPRVPKAWHGGRKRWGEHPGAGLVCRDHLASL